jgi:C4-dicarboxylate-specific signal transduction histidine kinase
MGEMAASIAHEINQPIGAIATNGAAAVRFLKQPAPDLGAVDEALDCIVRDANRAADVIVRIRSFLKKNPSPMSSLDMNEVIREVLALTAHEAATRHVTVASQLAESLPRVPGDRIQLQQVLLNLIMNALDAMNAIAERPRALHIQSSSDAESVFVKVLDSGNGWDPQHADAIFEPFFTTKKDGIGMGLTISRSIVEAHGGRLWGEPLEPYGAALTFTLPIAGTTQ